MACRVRALEPSEQVPGAVVHLGKSEHDAIMKHCKPGRGNKRRRSAVPEAAVVGGDVPEAVAEPDTPPKAKPSRADRAAARRASQGLGPEPELELPPHTASTKRKRQAPAVGSPAQAARDGPDVADPVLWLRLAQIDSEAGILEGFSQVSDCTPPVSGRKPWHSPAPYCAPRWR
jgi:hypothetical protein